MAIRLSVAGVEDMRLFEVDDVEPRVSMEGASHIRVTVGPTRTVPVIGRCKGDSP